MQKDMNLTNLTIPFDQGVVLPPQKNLTPASDNPFIPPKNGNSIIPVNSAATFEVNDLTVKGNFLSKNVVAETDTINDFKLINAVTVDDVSITFTKIGNTVTVDINDTYITTVTSVSSDIRVFTAGGVSDIVIPEKYRPSGVVYIASTIYGADKTLTGTVSVSNLGKMEFYNSTSTPWVATLGFNGIMKQSFTYKV